MTRYHFDDSAFTEMPLRKYFVDIKDFLGLYSERNVLHLTVMKVGRKCSVSKFYSIVSVGKNRLEYKGLLYKEVIVTNIHSKG